MTLTRLEYVDACLSAIKAPHDNTRHVTLMTRITQEWGNASGQGPRNNALDLTEHESGVTPFNSFGPDHAYHVWNYPTLEIGARAFHDILQATTYAQVLELLMHAPPKTLADEIIAAWNKTPWGFCAPSLVTQTRQNFNRYAAYLVKE